VFSSCRKFSKLFNHEKLYFDTGTSSQDINKDAITKEVRILDSINKVKVVEEKENLKKESLCMIK
jgi:hypothetical protein